MKKALLFLFFLFQLSSASADSDLIIREMVRKANTSIDSISLEYDGHRTLINKWVELYQKEKKVNVYNLFYPLLRGDSVFLYKIRVRVPKFMRYQYTKLSNENNIQFHFGNKDEGYIISVRQGEIEGFERYKSFCSNIVSEDSSQKRIRLLYFFQEAISKEHTYYISNDKELVYLVKYRDNTTSKKKNRLIQSVSGTKREDVRIIKLCREATLGRGGF